MLVCKFDYQNESISLNVDFKMETGVLGIVGRSGAGKSTFLKNIVGIHKPTRGLIELNHTKIVDIENDIFIPMHKRKIALVFQQATLFPHLNVKQNLLYPLKYLKRNKTKFEYDQIIEVLDIEKLLTKKSSQLSGGELQRISIGRALFSSPELLLLDEPLNGLDIELKNNVIQFINKVNHELHMPIIYVTHQKEELVKLNAQLINIDKFK